MCSLGYVVKSREIPDWRTLRIMVTMRVSLAGASSRYASVAGGLARLGFWLVTADVLVSTVVGIIGVVAWHDAGTGPGGGWRVPGMALLLAGALGIPGFLLGIIDMARGRWHCAGRLLAVAGPLLIFLGFFFGSHLLDPCARGWVDPQAGSCEWSHGTWNVHERYHLLYHTLVPTAGLVALYAAAMRRWYSDVTSGSTLEVERAV